MKKTQPDYTCWMTKVQKNMEPSEKQWSNWHWGSRMKSSLSLPALYIGTETLWALRDEPTRS